jgi:spermidine/putrescine transport system ATP-binding protein
MGEHFAVELISVTKRFGRIVAVRNMSIGILNGEFFSLLGPSGCGKTTTLRMIGGLEVPTEGEIIIGGESQGYTPPYHRPVNIVFQNYALFPHMTVAKNVSFGLEMQKVPKDEIGQRVEEALQMVQLSGFEKRKPEQLSGGQQQRVALARALINQPKVLLLDEPLGALDLKLRKSMQLELKALQERVGITFIYVTHDQEEALTMSDRIGVMNRGELLQVGTARDVYEAPSTRFVADFIGDTNSIEGEVVEIQDGIASVISHPDCMLKAHTVPGLAVNQTATVAFRPEKAWLGQDESDGEHNQIKCILTDVVYTGSFTTFVLRTPSGSELKVRRQNDEITSLTTHQPGDEVFVRWPIELTKAFPEEPTEDIGPQEV